MEKYTFKEQKLQPRIFLPEEAMKTGKVKTIYNNNCLVNDNLRLTCNQMTKRRHC